MSARSTAEDIAAAIPDRRVRKIESPDQAVALGAMLAKIFRLDLDCAFLVVRSLWDRSRKLRGAGR